MTNGEYVFYTIDMLPDEEVIDPESVWKGNDGRDADAKIAFESVFHVREISQFRVRFRVAALSAMFPILRYQTGAY